MNKKQSQLKAAILVFLFIGMSLFCQNCTVNTVPQSSRGIFEVEIISEPPGAYIEINGNYVGKAPIKVNIEGSYNRTFKRDTEIIANPINAGQFVQRKSFSGGYEYCKTCNDIIPERILFVMDLGKAPNKYDIEINKK